MSRSLYAMLHSRLGPMVSASERHARIEEKLRFDRQRWQPPLLSPKCLLQLKDTAVAIVGGGLAGLLAARDLRRQNVAVTLFEASQLLGGRVHSDIRKGRIIEMGAELIGSMHVMWRDLAIEYGLAWVSRMDGGSYAREGLAIKVWLDKLLSEKELRKLEKDMLKILTEISKDARGINDASQPWLEPKLEKFDKMSVGDKLKILKIKKTDRLWKAMEQFLTNNNVAPLEELNYLGLLCLVKGGNLGPDHKGMMGYWDELEIFRCADGCQKLATKMAYEITKNPKGKIELNAEVTHIDVKETVALQWKKKLDNKKLEERGGTFDFVILAIPPSVWGKVRITPEHPKDKIGPVGMGAAAKFFSDVKERFWIKDRAAPIGGSLKMGQVWEGTDNQTRVYDQAIVLSVFTGNTIPPETQYQQGLKELYPKYQDNLLGTVFVDWSDPNKKPFVQTGYASPKKGQIFRIGKKLIEPIQKRLFLAGEHTQMDFFGYMEGALRSGARAANAVMRQACVLPQPKIPAPDRPREPIHIARAAPIREREAFEREIENLLN
jgi:monoamine oxidase